VHLHSTRAAAIPKILAAYDAGCRRFDSAMGGRGGCPIAPDELVGNIPTEEILRALEQRGVKLPLQASLGKVIALNDAIADEFAG
jgi:hydroxymethylglutaryl-CoA lyase